jgi:hypothetical protein
LPLTIKQRKLTIIKNVVQGGAMKQLFCRDLKPGDILLKMATGGFTQRLIQLGQSLAGQPNAFLGHAAIALDTQFIIEAQRHGITGNHLAMKDRDCGYIVYRPLNVALGQGAATAAKLLFDVHQRQGNLRYGAVAAVGSLFGSAGTAKSGGEMDALLDRILANKSQPFFCSQFVVYVYHWAASQSGIQPQSVFSLSDAKATPSLLASRLVGSALFTEVGYMLPNER